MIFKGTDSEFILKMINDVLKTSYAGFEFVSDNENGEKDSVCLAEKRDDMSLRFLGKKAVNVADFVIFDEIAGSNSETFIYLKLK
jgi:hypothetical protein